MKMHLAALALAVIPCALQAQAVLPVVQLAAPIASPGNTQAVLRVGTEVPLRLLEELTTKGKSCGWAKE
jgi:hypothetical protein